ncbi:tetratricopeptide repeat protein [Edaphobacter modestus]|uniref:Tetratricopeptide repeat protein n=1 Tax=Edaphobacter modestus TaxID=388466 RepID=A0A4Q7YWX8_9BACT|nr:tetratricopeptide repeat protein [Edaphobacter modestus]RZU41914.1 tetratricopeptide repeat protein [Edaphobacter modestus]
MEQESQPHIERRRQYSWWIGLLALLYAFIAGMRTTVDFDLGWQMAAGRYVLEHHAIPRIDIFSYTIAGASWFYPPLPGVLFYLLFRAGDYAAISWLCAGAVVTCVFLLIYRRGLLARVLVLLAVPVIASETMPRASLFTMLLVAAVGRLLVSHAEGRRVPLWLLPLGMVLWTNLHPGFVAGLAMMLGYCVVELGEMIATERRAAAMARLRAAAPWMLLSLPAMLVNPFGVRMLRVVFDQQRAITWQSVLLEEWQPVRLSQAINELGWRSADGAVWWLLLISAALTIALLINRRWGAAIVIVGAWSAFIAHSRMEGACVLIVCLIGGATLDSFESERVFQRPNTDRTAKAVGVALAAIMTLLVAVRSYDIVTNRASLADGQITLFGTGSSWWIPQRAVDALEQLHPAGNVFAPFDLGSYLVFRVGDQYKDFADGRAVPFGRALIEEQQRLTATPLDDPLWTAASQRYNIQAAIFPLSRLMALGEAPLAQDCVSTGWAAVYMDSTAIILARRSPQNAALIARTAIDCRTHDLLREMATENPSRLARMNNYQQMANTAAIYAALGRTQDAVEAMRRAKAITMLPDPSLLFVRAQIAAAMGAPQVAEALLRQALAAEPSDASWYNLALLLASQQRYNEAVAALERAAHLSQQPYDRYLLAGQMLLAGRDPAQSLAYFDRATQASPYAQQQGAAAREFRAATATGRAEAYLATNRLTDAITQQKLAVAETPDDRQRQELLKKLCGVPGSDCTP